MDVEIYNTLTRKKETFIPIEKGSMSMYNCGPTVYSFAHIGNLRTFVFADILRRVFEYNNFEVKQVVNITDVGHLTSDGDEGEDKLEQSAHSTGKTAQEIAEFYTKAFFDDLMLLGIDTGKIIFPKATEHIVEQIQLIKKLEEKGFTYKTEDGIYFDTSKLSDYGKLARLDIAGLKEGARIKMTAGKKNITDFALWKLSKSKKERQQEWESPWGVGFPGWHLECSAMSMKYLGEHFDIHTGGIDLIPTHHTNEIAQSEAVTGNPFVNYWMHSNFINIDGKKMSKSLGNILVLTDLIKKGFNPVVYRYWLLTAHYSTLVNFTWETLIGAKTALEKLHKHFSEYENKGEINKKYQTKFHKYINDNLDTPKAIALIWELIKDDTVSGADKKATILDMDKVLGLGFTDIKKETIPDNILHLVKEREKARVSKNWEKSDEIRDELKKLGYEVEDTNIGSRITKIKN